VATLPTDYDTIMAEDLRQEVGNKITAVGLYLGDDIVIPNTVTPGPGVILGKVTFVTRLKNGDGKWKGSWSIIGPNNAAVISSNADFDVEKLPNVFHGVITSTILPVSNTGDYKYILTLGGQQYEYDFRVTQ